MTGGPVICQKSGSPIPDLVHQPLLATRAVSKRFGATLALTDVDFACSPGEVHAVVGQNGAGKSTLMNLFAGVFPPTSGDILLNGVQVRFGHPAEARAAGIRTVYQVPDLIPHLNVAQNLFLGEEPTSATGLLSHRKLYEQAQRLLERLHLDLPLRQPVSSLSLSQQQLVTVARALASPLQVLILDEPTAPLGPHESEFLFKLIRRCRDDGLAILYISHRLEEVMHLADQVTVLRDGKLVATGPTGRTSKNEIISQMTGGKLVDLQQRKLGKASVGPVVLDVRNLEAAGLGPITFQVRAGEVVGIAGLVGSGRSELLRHIFGADRPSAGEVTLWVTHTEQDAPVSERRPAAEEATDEPPGKRRELRLRLGDPQRAVAAGIGFLTEERLFDGLAAALPVKVNLSMTRLKEMRSERHLAVRMIERLQIRGGPDQAVRELSGGNQQKVALGKWLKEGLRLLLVDEPTQGVDVSAKEELHRQLRELADQGVAVLLVSSEFPELLSLSDRILVMRAGSIVMELPGGAVGEEELLAAAVG